MKRLLPSAAVAAALVPASFSQVFEETAVTTAPPQLLAHAAARRFSGDHVLIGGYTEPATDTHLWNGTSWSVLTGVGLPFPIVEIPAALNPITDRVVIAAAPPGASGGVLQVFEFDGTSWQAFAPTSGPSERTAHAFANDFGAPFPLITESMLFGGLDNATGNVLSDLWAWNGATWRSITTAVVPPARSHAVMVHEFLNGSVVMFGGRDGAGNPLGDTWILERFSSGFHTWNPVTSPGPTPVWGHAMAYDATRDVVVMSGGFLANGSLSDKVWELDMSTQKWRKVVGQTVPPHVWHSLTYDPPRDQMMLYAPNTGPEVPATRTWVRSSPFLTFGVPPVVLGPACPQLPLFVTTDTPARLGQPWVLDLMSAPPGALAAIAVSFTSSGSLAPCGFHVQGGATFTVTPGPGALTLAIPSDPALVGLDLLSQGAIVSGGVVTTTGSLRAMITP